VTTSAPLPEPGRADPGPNRRLRQLVEARRGLVVPGAFNGLSARVIADFGYEALYVTGAGVTNGHLGLPDVGLISLSELAAHVAAIRNVVELPLIVDADTGFGNPVNVWHSVRVLERAGASAIQLEDQVFPKRCGHFDGKAVIPAEEMAQKVRAACAARTDPDVMIIARTDGYALEGLEGALARARLYIEAGADMTFVEAPRTEADLGRVIGALPVPQLVNMVIGGRTPPVSAAMLAEMGAGVVLYANAALQGAILGMQRALEELGRAGMITDDSGVVARFEERQRLVGKPAVDALEARFATPGES
jgi:2-methylisocitrate lyase-like PEP mutase family enzyme